MIATMKRDAKVVTKRDDVLTDPPRKCLNGHPISNVLYLSAAREPRCAGCALAGGPELRARKYVKAPGTTFFRKVEG